jgi:hypothetical protein
MWIRSAEVWIKKARESMAKHGQESIVKLSRLKIANSCLTAAMGCIHNAFEDMKLMGRYCLLHERGFELAFEIEDMLEKLEEIVENPKA